MRSRRQLDIADILRDTSSPGRARLYVQSFVGPLTRDIGCWKFGAWCKPDSVDRDRIFTVFSHLRDSDLEFLSVEWESARGVLLGEEDLREGSTPPDPYLVRLYQVGGPLALLQLGERMRSDPEVFNRGR